MLDVSLLTAESFLEGMPELPEGGRWCELIRGRVETLSAPEETHRLVVFNLSKALGQYLSASAEGYACFDLGLIVARNPDTVRFPAVSYFMGGEPFAEVDNVITETHPALVTEVLSSNDRRRSLNDRVHDYLTWGVDVLWLIDPNEHAVHIIRSGCPNKSLRDHETLSGSLTWKHKGTGQPILPDFHLDIATLFAEPESWRRS